MNRNEQESNRGLHVSDRTNPFIDRQPLKTGGKGPFMERVRRALGRKPGQPLGELPPERDETVRQVAAGAPREALVARFMERAKGNTMVVQKVAGDAGSVAGALNGCLEKHRVGRSILNARELEGPLGLKGVLEARGIQVVPWGVAHSKDEAFGCEASVTDCRCAMADSGSLLVWSDAEFGRSSTLVVPVHVVLLPASRILPDMIEALAYAFDETAGKSAEGRLPSNIVIINGPSKTADIEMNLVTGVHGPKFLYVVVMEGL